MDGFLIYLAFRLHLACLSQSIPKISPEKQHNFELQLRFFSVIFCEVYQAVVPAAYTIHFKLMYL